MVFRVFFVSVVSELLMIVDWVIILSGIVSVFGMLGF